MIGLDVVNFSTRRSNFGGIVLLKDNSIFRKSVYEQQYA